MSRTYKLTATNIYGGKTTTRDIYLSTFSADTEKRVGCWRSGTTDYWGAVSIFFDAATMARLRTKTIQTMSLNLACNGTFAYAVDIFYNKKANASTTDWSQDNYAYTVNCPRYETIPDIDVTDLGVPDYDAYVLGGYYKTYAYTTITSATLTVVTSETSKKITYNANGGSNTPSATVIWGEGSWAGNVTTSTPTRTGYSFAGWNTKANGTGTSYASGASISITSNITLYAQWTALYSTLNSASNANITETTTVSWTNYGTFTNTLRFIFGSVDSGEISVSGTSYAYTLPSTWYAQTPNATSGTATVYLYTYVDGVLIGTSSRTFTASVKSSVKPSIGNLIITQVNAKWGLYLQKYSKASFQITGGTAGTGATIRSYSIVGESIDYSEITTSSVAGADTGVFNRAGDFTFTITITDSRGRKGVQTVTLTVTPYNEPAISTLKSVRCDSDGTTNQVTGTSLKAQFTYAWSNVGSNMILARLYYKKHTDADYTTATGIVFSDGWRIFAQGLAEISSSYDVKLEITDSLNNSATYVTVVPPVAGIAFGLKNDRARFGGPVEKAGLQVDWDAEFNGVLTVTNRTAEASLSSTGWYRVLEFSATSVDTARGSIGMIIDFNITKANDSEAHYIRLFGVSGGLLEFADERSKSVSQLIDKIRYTYNSTTYKAYVDIHYTGSASRNVNVDFAVHIRSSWKSSFRTLNLLAVADAPSGETIATTYEFLANTGAIGGLEFATIASGSSGSINVPNSSSAFLFSSGIRDGSKFIVAVRCNSGGDVSHVEIGTAGATFSVSANTLTISNTSGGALNILIVRY